MKQLPLQERSISDIFNDAATYRIPIYQRNYAWGEDEITALIKDVCHALEIDKHKIYYIGTLVTYHRGDGLFEVIDGQQRLTTIYLILRALGISFKSKLSYSARDKADLALKHIGVAAADDLTDDDPGIVRGFSIAQEKIQDCPEGFAKFFLHNVHIIHYDVPRDIDLNHYFEVMNSRGEQLEMHEVVKARLMGVQEGLTDDDRRKFAAIWDACSVMDIYVQRMFQNDANVFGPYMNKLVAHDFKDISDCGNGNGKKPIKSLLSPSWGSNELSSPEDSGMSFDGEDPVTYKFQPIIDFPNFLLIVLKLTRWMTEEDFDPKSFNLDDKELIHEFDKVKKIDAAFVKLFAFNLLKSRYLLDNFVVHHSLNEDRERENPWRLQCYHREGSGKSKPRNLAFNKDLQDELVQLLSMFEVSFTPRPRKNYLFYCLLHLFRNEDLNGYGDFSRGLNGYRDFLSSLAKKYMHDVYLVKDNLNAINVPTPGSFDGRILDGGKLNIEVSNPHPDFNEIYGDGSEVGSLGIPLFVFNYMDYKLWKYYADTLRGEETNENSPKRRLFFELLGCSDFGLNAFNDFYFSRTRRSLEHYFPQALAEGDHPLINKNEINCFGNYAMIGAAINSSGSDQLPIAKLDVYLRDGKEPKLGAASLKFRIMMQVCQDNYGNRPHGQEWTFSYIQRHQHNMTKILLG